MPARKRPPGFTFNTATGQYRNERTGRVVSGAELRRAFESTVRKSTQRVEALAAQLRTGAISVEQWEVSIREEIKDTHLIAAMVAKGGRAQMTQADFGSIGGRLAREYRYLQRFADQVVSGEVSIDGRFTRRSQMYAMAARGTFHEVGRGAAREQGFTHERNILKPGESCRGCVAATAMGSVPIGTLPPIGERDCLKNCRCEIRFTRGPGPAPRLRAARNRSAS